MFSIYCSKFLKRAHNPQHSRVWKADSTHAPRCILYMGMCVVRDGTSMWSIIGLGGLTREFRRSRVVCLMSDSRVSECIIFNLVFV